jgi:hypothetical protein
MKYGLPLAVTVAFGLAWTAPGFAAKPARRDPLVEQVRKSIKFGIKYLRGKQMADGSWEVDTYSATRRGGWTSLVLLALLNAGVSPDDKAVKKGLEWLRKVNPSDTYVVALQTMVFYEARKNEDSERIQRNVDWLIKTRKKDGTKLLGWTYKEGMSIMPDNSNTQYALLGLHAGRLAGAKVPRNIWREVRDFYERTQTAEGGWIYNRSHMSRSYLTMDIAGLCGLIISGEELNRGRVKFDARGHHRNCGVYQEDKKINKALSWITNEQRFTINFPNRVYYNLYGIERAGRLSGWRFLGRYDWYRMGCEFLIKKQDMEAEDKDRGAWTKGTYFDQWPVINTSFALLFLSKGRTPVLISKIVHGPGEDWNNDRNDARHLVEFASKALFKRQPLAWQVFNARKVEADTPERFNDLTSDLLQSPIAYFNGHEAPEFTAREIKLLKKYVDNGGFILAEACCGRKEFDRSFRTKVIEKLFPDDKLVPLESGHPVWSAFFRVPPGSFHLMGIKRGCKTVAIYAPQDMSCLWEANNLKTAQGQKAFRLGANIIAYATGLELPKPRGFRAEVIDEAKDVPRNAFKVAQINHGGPNWQPAPNAMRNLLDHLEKTAGLRVNRDTAETIPNSKNIFKYKFLYMHGNTTFPTPKNLDKVERLRNNLKWGAVLFADACCGSTDFDKSFRAFVKKVFPDEKLVPIPEKDFLYSEDLNGEKLDENNIRSRIKRPEGKGKGTGYRLMAPALEGIKIKGRWVIIYSKYDIGCALEKRQSTDCLGYDHESALKLGKAAVLYALRR